MQNCGCLKGVKKKRNSYFLVVCVFVLCTILGCGEKDTDSAENELIIFHAGSLSIPFREISAEFQKTHPNIVIKAEASGSRAAARKISDLQRQCDIIGSADYKVVANLLMLNCVGFNIQFALNEMIIAYTDKSKYSETVIRHFL